MNLNVMLSFTCLQSDSMQRFEPGSNNNGFYRAGGSVSMRGQLFGPDTETSVLTVVASLKLTR